MWRLNVGILNSEQQKEKVKAEIKRYIDENNNGAVDPTIVWDAMKVVIRGKLIAETAYQKKVKLESYRTNTERLRELEQGSEDTSRNQDSKNKDKQHITRLGGKKEHIPETKLLCSRLKGN